MKYKVGDRVVCMDAFRKVNHRGIIISFGKVDPMFPIDIVYDDGGRDSWKDIPHIVLESVYDSPLMEALEEE